MKIDSSKSRPLVLRRSRRHRRKLGIRLVLSALLVSAGVVLASCGDIPTTAPAAPPSNAVAGDLLGSLSGVLNGLLSCSPMSPATASKVIGVNGGTIQVGPHKLVVPAGALSHNVTITASIKAERVNRVHFEPDGLQFAKQATLTMSYDNCSLVNSLLPKRIAYVTPGLGILQHLLSLDNLLSNNVSAKLDHFSDYAVESSAFSDWVVSW